MMKTVIIIMPPPTRRITNNNSSNRMARMTPSSSTSIRQPAAKKPSGVRILRFLLLAVGLVMTGVVAGFWVLPSVWWLEETKDAGRNGHRGHTMTGSNDRFHYLYPHNLSSSVSSLGPRREYHDDNHTTKPTKTVSPPRLPEQHDKDTQQNNTSDPCHLNFKGILHIAQGDYNGGTTAILIFFVLHQLAYAEQHQLLPWIHLNDFSQWVYDPIVHGGVLGSKEGRHDSDTFWMRTGHFTHQHSHCHRDCHCPPFVDRISDQPEPHTVPPGNGVWHSYFRIAPSSPFAQPAFDPLSLSSSSCLDWNKIPLIQLSLPQLTHGLHTQCNYTAKAWRRGGMPPHIRRDDLSDQDWLYQQRVRGAELVRRHVRLQPELAQRVQRALSHQEEPGVEEEDSQQQKDDSDTTRNTAVQCLAVHIRHSDKGHGRKRVPVRDFFPYVQAYVEHYSPSTNNNNNDSNNDKEGHTTNRPFVYLATDSSPVLTEIQETWPRHVWHNIRTQDRYDFGSKTDDLSNNTTTASATKTGSILRSPNTTAVFALAKNQQDPSNKPTFSRHDANLQVLTDALAMSHCQFLLHGLSGVTETAIFFNLNLHHGAINLEDDNHASVETFQTQLKQVKATE